MHFNYRRHFFYTLLTAFIAVILAGAIGYAAGNLERGAIAGLFVGAAYGLVGLGLAVHTSWRYWRQTKRVQRMERVPPQKT